MVVTLDVNSSSSAFKSYRSFRDTGCRGANQPVHDLNETNLLLLLGDAACINWVRSSSTQEAWAGAFGHLVILWHRAWGRPLYHWAALRRHWFLCSLFSDNQERAIIVAYSALLMAAIGSLALLSKRAAWQTDNFFLSGVLSIVLYS